MTTDQVFQVEKVSFLLRTFTMTDYEQVVDL